MSGEEVPLDQVWRVADLSGVDTDAALEGLNDLLEDWGEAESDWRQGEFREISRDSHGVNYSFTLIDHDGEPYRCTWRVTEGMVEPLRVEMVDRDAMMRGGLVLWLVVLLVVVGVPTLVILAAIAGVVWCRIRRAKA